MSGGFGGSSLKLRVISALVAVAILLGVGWQFGAFGLQFVVALVILLSLREFSRMGLQGIGGPWTLTMWFWGVALTLLVGLVRSDESALVTALCFSAFLTVSMWLTRNRLSNERLLGALTLGLLGLTVCVLLPFYDIQILRLPNGMAWFALHLLIVFGGDVAAYFGGIAFGKEKLMPQVSPKKTIVGAWSGLIGSVVIGLGFAFFVLPNHALWQVALVSGLVGFVAQMGDLLMSLIKRVANVKDSGGLMPGHGGILDRVDGILVTCPLLYAYAFAAETWL